MDTTMGFAAVHFGAAKLGHKKRTKCLVRIADRIFRHPGGSLPTKLYNPNDYKAMDRLMNRPEVTHAAVLAAHYQHTQEQMRRAPGPILILHDTTELDYSGLKSIDDLGSLGNGRGRGYLCHNSLVFDPQQAEVLGLANQILHRRRRVGRKEGIKAKRQRVDRESRLWLWGVEAVGPAPAGQRWIHISDRGADTFEYLAQSVQNRREFVTRSKGDRRIHRGHDEQAAKDFLHTYAQSLPLHGGKTVSVAARCGQAQRRAEVAVTWAPVLVCPPHVRRGIYHKEPLRLWVVCVRESDPPRGLEPLEWMLLTNIAVANEAEAWEVVSWYEKRWVIEEYHKAQKTGCSVEQLQFTSRQALEPMVALLSVVAVSLLNLREASRRPDAKERPAREVVDDHYVAVLSDWRYGKVRDLSVHDFFFALARLGGHQNRKCDHRPGWLVLWRGWIALQHLVEGTKLTPFKKRHTVSTICGQS